MSDNVVDLGMVKRFPREAEMCNRLLATCYLFENLGVASVLGCLQQVMCRTTDNLAEEEEILCSQLIEVLDDYVCSEAIKDGCLLIIQQTIYVDNFLAEE